MPNSQSSRPQGVPANSRTAKRDISEPLKPPGPKDTKGELEPSFSATIQDADTAIPLTATLKPSDLDTLRLFLSLLAGYLAKIQGTKRGRVLMEQLVMKQPNQKRYKVVKILIGIDSAGIEVVENNGELTLGVVEREADDEKKT